MFSWFSSGVELQKVRAERDRLKHTLRGVEGRNQVLVKELEWAKEKLATERAAYESMQKDRDQLQKEVKKWEMRWEPTQQFIDSILEPLDQLRVAAEKLPVEMFDSEET